MSEAWLLFQGSLFVACINNPISVSAACSRLAGIDLHQEKGRNSDATTDSHWRGQTRVQHWPAGKVHHVEACLW